MVLVIGIVVDDAIVVVENVERDHERARGCRPAQATRKAMGQISGAIVGVTVVLVVGLRAAGLLQRRGRQHLPPVLGGDGRVDRCCRRSWRCRSRRPCARRC
ncbi:MAG: efflux RND transporter permease subunit [Comamonadaceae bacterium]|nr:efflux RND transporter permease subunit [Comamonadaceae bacterium]